MTNDEKMLRKAKENLERIRKKYSGDLLKFYEPSAIYLVEAYEKRVQEGRRASTATEILSVAEAGYDCWKS